MTKIDFEVETDYGVYRDALYLTEEEEATLTEQDIEAIKQSRVDNWIAVVTAPPVPQEELPLEVVEEVVAEAAPEEVVAPVVEEVPETPV